MRAHGLPSGTHTVSALGDAPVIADKPYERIYSVRLLALTQAAKDVCTHCGRRSFPDEPVNLLFPDSGHGNYTHDRGGRPRVICDASAIWARIRFEYSDQWVGIGLFRTTP